MGRLGADSGDGGHGQKWVPGDMLNTGIQAQEVGNASGQPPLSSANLRWSGCPFIWGASCWSPQILLAPEPTPTHYLSFYLQRFGCFPLLFTIYSTFWVPCHHKSLYKHTVLSRFPQNTEPVLFHNVGKPWSLPQKKKKKKMSWHKNDRYWKL